MPQSHMAYLSLSLLIAGSLVVLGISTSARADDIDEIQRRDLALVQAQIEQIQIVAQRIDARQRSADPAGTRFFFDIPRLQGDLESIARGIDLYLSPDRLQPRVLSPLEGDYLNDRAR